jgi:hypothetical protein
VESLHASWQDRHLRYENNPSVSVRPSPPCRLPRRSEARTAQDFQITKITKNLISTPNLLMGADNIKPIKASLAGSGSQFTATPEFTGELTFKYYPL